MPAAVDGEPERPAAPVAVRSGIMRDFECSAAGGATSVIRWLQPERPNPRMKGYRGYRMTQCALGATEGRHGGWWPEGLEDYVFRDRGRASRLGQVKDSKNIAVTRQLN